EHARVRAPRDLELAVAERVELLASRHGRKLKLAAPVAAAGSTNGHVTEDASEGKRETAIRPERFARLVTLASILIEAGREARQLRVADVCERLQVSEQELREDVNVLNVVNFG